MNKTNKLRALVIHLTAFAGVVSGPAWADDLPAPNEPAPLSCRIQAIKHDLLNQHENGVLVAAHRGHHVTLPENSLASILSAADVGADIVELDVQVSNDGVPVLMHDATLDRTTTGSGEASALTLDELKALRLRDPQGDVTDHQIPTLAEALEAARGRIFVDVDLKSEQIDLILGVIAQAEMIDQVMFYHADPDVRARVLARAPEALVMPIARTPEDVAQLIRSEQPPIVHLREAYNAPGIAALLDTHQVAGWTNALGEADTLARTHGVSVAFDPIIANRPDIIQTDLPEDLVNHLRSRGLHSSYADQNCTEDALAPQAPISSKPDILTQPH